MTDEEIEQLQERRTNVIAQINALTITAPGGAPNTLYGEGERIDHVGYKKSLYDELKNLNEVLGISEPWEVWS